MALAMSKLSRMKISAMAKLPKMKISSKVKMPRMKVLVQAVKDTDDLGDDDEDNDDDVAADDELGDADVDVAIVSACGHGILLSLSLLRFGHDFIHLQF